MSTILVLMLMLTLVLMFMVILILTLMILILKELKHLMLMACCALGNVLFYITH